MYISLSLSSIFYYLCYISFFFFFFFFFQAEDGIRDLTVTGVQTCALPICAPTQACPRAQGAGRRGNCRGGTELHHGVSDATSIGEGPFGAAYADSWGDRKSVV